MVSVCTLLRASLQRVTGGKWRETRVMTTPTTINTINTIPPSPGDDASKLMKTTLEGTQINQANNKGPRLPAPSLCWPIKTSDHSLRDSAIMGGSGGAHIPLWGPGFTI